MRFVSLSLCCLMALSFSEIVSTQKANSIVDNVMYEYYRGMYSGLINSTYVIESLPPTCINWTYTAEQANLMMDIFFKCFMLQYLYTPGLYLENDLREIINKELDHMKLWCNVEEQAKLMREFFDMRGSMFDAFFVLGIRTFAHAFYFIWTIGESIYYLFLWDWFSVGHSFGSFNKLLYANS